MKTYLLSLLLTFIASSSLFATDQAESSLFDHWAETVEPTEVTIYMDMAALESNRMTANRIKAKLNDGEHEYDLTLNVRGRFRRRTCAVPPLKLHFDKQWLRKIGFNKHNDFKLVTHCTRDEEGQESILREQLAYKLYQVVSPKASYRTQLLKVTYVDTQDGSTESSYAILIEDTDELKDRINAKSRKDCYGVASTSVKNEGLVSLFNYMIGNTDFSFKMNRNIKLFNIEGEKQSTAVPYDFDFSTLVNARYAGHSGHTDTPRKLVWEYGETSKSLSAARGQLIYQKKEILETVQHFELISKRSRQEILEYLYDFFVEIEHSRLAR